MRIFSLLILWAAAIALSVTLFSYGQVRYYWYENDKGRGYELPAWKGDTLDDQPGYEKGYSYRRVIHKFERNSEGRTILIILILTGASAVSVRIWKQAGRQDSKKVAT